MSYPVNPSASSSSSGMNDRREADPRMMMNPNSANENLYSRHSTWVHPALAYQNQLPGLSWRKGKWTEEEEFYAKKLIDAFNGGYLKVSSGTTLRSFLAERLCCDPMRITKKFAGSSCIGKQVFSAGDGVIDDSKRREIQEELKALEKSFMSKLDYLHKINYPGPDPAVPYGAYHTNGPNGPNGPRYMGHCQHNGQHTGHHTGHNGHHGQHMMHGHQGHQGHHQGHHQSHQRNHRHHGHIEGRMPGMMLGHTPGFPPPYYGAKHNSHQSHSHNGMHRMPSSTTSESTSDSASEVQIHLLRSDHSMPLPPPPSGYPYPQQGHIRDMRGGRDPRDQREGRDGRDVGQNDGHRPPPPHMNHNQHNQHHPHHAHNPHQMSRHPNGPTQSQGQSHQHSVTAPAPPQNSAPSQLRDSTQAHTQASQQGSCQGGLAPPYRPRQAHTSADLFGRQYPTTIEQMNFLSSENLRKKLAADNTMPSNGFHSGGRMGMGDAAKFCSAAAHAYSDKIQVDEVKRVKVESASSLSVGSVGSAGSVGSVSSTSSSSGSSSGRKEKEKEVKKEKEVRQVDLEASDLLLNFFNAAGSSSTKKTGKDGRDGSVGSVSGRSGSGSTSNQGDGDDSVSNFSDAVDGDVSASVSGRSSSLSSDRSDNNSDIDYSSHDEVESEGKSITDSPMMRERERKVPVDKKAGYHLAPVADADTFKAKVPRLI